ncbi:MAG TPA: ion transporter [Marine Group III euryarchaeote]|uniref:Ion transporter n=1 Tax=Marine Group III euryarchaeote TaxID=2173149 RepID=A0A7J4D1B0_9ARCH|nr:ion transporter [Marine Group III euryarchaeote]
MSSKMVDVDGDDLDDRLVDQVGPGESDIRSIAERVDNIRLVKLPTPVLERIYEDIQRDLDKVVERAKTIEEELHIKLLDGDGSSLEEAHKEMAQCKREADEIEDYKTLIYDALQEAKLKKRMIEFLGSERRANLLEITVLALIVVVLGFMTWELFYLQGSEHADTRLNIFYLDAGCCVIFLTEFFLRYKFAEDRRWYVRNHWIDFVTSIPIPAVSELRYGRSVRLLRLIRALRVLRAFRIIFFFWRGMDHLSSVVNVKLMKKSMKGICVIMILGAFIIQLGEGENDASVGSFAESMWWSFTTVVTGGFADIYNPTTTGGRFLTVLLIISGMIIVGVFTATLTSLYVEEGTEELQMMQKTLDERFTNLANSHEQGTRERHQGIYEREVLDRKLSEGMTTIFNNQKELSDKIEELDKKINSK